MLHCWSLKDLSRFSVPCTKLYVLVMTNCCFMNYVVDNCGIVSQTFEIVG